MKASFTICLFNPMTNIEAGAKSKHHGRFFGHLTNFPCGIFNSFFGLPFSVCFSVYVDLALTLQCFNDFREFSHWKVNSLATEKRDFLKAPLPLAPEFLRNLRLLGRRPTLQQINENLIKKYGTHFLVSATLGGKEGLANDTLAFNLDGCGVAWRWGGEFAHEHSQKAEELLITATPSKRRERLILHFVRSGRCRAS